MKKRHEIWNNDVNEMIESLRESGDEFTMEQMYAQGEEDTAYGEIERWLDDERANLNIEVDGDIVCFGTLQRWNGSFSAYKELESNNISNIFTAIDIGDNLVSFYEQGGELCAESTGHDNPVSPSVFTFRAWKKNTTEKTKENVLSAFYRNDPKKWEIANKNTKKLGNYVKKVYGW